MAYLLPKGKGNTSMPVKRREAKALEAKRHRKTRAIASALDCSNPSLRGRNGTSTGRTLETGTAPLAWCGGVAHAPPKGQPLAMSHGRRRTGDLRRAMTYDVTEQGIAYGARARGRRSSRSRRGGCVPPGRTGKPSTGPRG